MYWQGFLSTSILHSCMVNLTWSTQNSRQCHFVHHITWPEIAPGPSAVGIGPLTAWTVTRPLISVQRIACTHLTMVIRWPKYVAVTSAETELAGRHTDTIGSVFTLRPYTYMDVSDSSVFSWVGVFKVTQCSSMLLILVLITPTRIKPKAFYILD
jgi:hypothetical protein